MQKHLAIGRGVKILDQKTERGGSTNPPPPSASLRVKSNEELSNESRHRKKVDKKLRESQRKLKSR